MAPPWHLWSSGGYNCSITTDDAPTKYKSNAECKVLMYGMWNRAKTLL